MIFTGTELGAETSENSEFEVVASEGTKKTSTKQQRSSKTPSDGEDKTPRSTRSRKSIRGSKLKTSKKAEESSGSSRTEVEENSDNPENNLHQLNAQVERVLNMQGVETNEIFLTDDEDLDGKNTKTEQKPKEDSMKGMGVKNFLIRLMVGVLLGLSIFSFVQSNRRQEFSIIDSSAHYFVQNPSSTHFMLYKICIKELFCTGPFVLEPNQQQNHTFDRAELSEAMRSSKLCVHHFLLSKPPKNPGSVWEAFSSHLPTHARQFALVEAKTNNKTIF